MQVLPHPGVRQAHALTLTLFPKPPATHGIKPAKPTKLYLTVCHEWSRHITSVKAEFSMILTSGIWHLDIWYDITSRTAVARLHKWVDCSVMTSQMGGVFFCDITSRRTAVAWKDCWKDCSVNFTLVSQVSELSSHHCIFIIDKTCSSKSRDFSIQSLQF